MFIWYAKLLVCVKNYTFNQVMIANLKYISNKQSEHTERKAKCHEIRCLWKLNIQEEDFMGQNK